MDAAVLLSIGVEADRVVGAQHIGDRLLDPGLGDLQLAEDAVEGEHDLRLPDAGADLRESRLEVADEIDALGHTEYDAALDGTVELEAAVGIDLLDRTHVVAAVDEDDDG